MESFFIIHIALYQYKNCYIGTRPLYAIVTGKSTSSATITLIRNMLNGTDLNKLQAAGIVTNKIERLVRYTGGSVREYVGSYGNYYNGLSGSQKGIKIAKQNVAIVFITHKHRLHRVVIFLQD